MAGMGHVLVLPFPAQGHVNPLMRVSREMAKHGFKITFVNTEFIHKRVVSAIPDEGSLRDSNINLVSISDGLDCDDDRIRYDFGKAMEALLRTMPARLEELIQGIHASNGDDDDDNITCILADGVMGWAMEVAIKMGIRGAVFWTAAAAGLALQMSVPRLIDDGILNGDGFPIKKVERIELSPGIPAFEMTNLPWAAIPDPTAQKILFHYIARNMEASKLADWWLCNTAYELEPGSFAFFPKLLPIGPILDDSGDQTGQFRREDSSCLNWLNQQAPRSVIYISFGSYATLDAIQFEELALGLKLVNRPFLWVVDQNNMDRAKNEFPNESLGAPPCTKIVDWAPQTKVLAHPAVACFISHCGWNSVTEGITNGVPFLCWPQFVDQFIDKSYICDDWKVGLGFDQLAENGIIMQSEVAKKVEQLLGNESIRARALEFKEIISKTRAEGGQSSKNFNKFIRWLKE